MRGAAAATRISATNLQSSAEAARPFASAGVDAGVWRGLATGEPMRPSHRLYDFPLSLRTGFMNGKGARRRKRSRERTSEGPFTERWGIRVSSESHVRSPVAGSSSSLSRSERPGVHREWTPQGLGDGGVWSSDCEAAGGGRTVRRGPDTSRTLHHLDDRPLHDEELEFLADSVGHQAQDRSEESQ